MTNNFIDNVDAPPPIKEFLATQSKDISFTKNSNKGCNGYVFFGDHKILQEKRAIKIYFWDNKKNFHTEPKYLASINSQNILPIKNAGYIDDEWAYFDTQYCPNGDLDDYLVEHIVGNKESIDFIHAVLTGLSQLHSERYVHRDLKPENIYLDNSNNPVIGDFGSLRVIPQGKSEIPASSNSLLYRPPEAIQHQTYSQVSDIYQVGVVLYQLLGGELSYVPEDWLKDKERKQLASLANAAEQSDFIDACIHSKITSNKLLRLDSLPFWVPKHLKKIVRKATSTAPAKRYQCAADFQADLHRARARTHDWQCIDGIPTLLAPDATSYRILKHSHNYQVEKKKSGAWRKDNSIESNDPTEIVLAIEARL